MVLQSCGEDFAFRIVAVIVKGDLGGSWSWDGYYEYGRDTNEQDLDELDLDEQGLDAER